MSSRNIFEYFTEHDRSVLQGSKSYEDYFQYIKLAFGRIIENFNQRNTEDPRETAIVKQYLQQLLNTIQLLQLKYRFEKDDKMLIDRTDSSFPNHYELKKLLADVEYKEAELNKLEDKETLKRAILDFVFLHKTKPESLLQNLGRVEYYTKLDELNFFSLFNHGSIEPIQGNPNRFFYYWSTYDSVTNRPFIYLLIFEVDPKKRDQMLDEWDQIEQVIEKATHNTSPLNVVAVDLDMGVNYLYPKIVKRIDIGPIFGRYALDKNPMTTLINEKFSPNDYAFYYTTEVIFSIGEQRNSSFLSKGELRQIFFIDESNKDCMERHVSQVHKYLLCSHSLAQYLHVNKPASLEELALPAFTF